MRKLKLILIIFVCTLALSFSIVSVATANGLLLDEDFELVDPGDIPLNWWSYLWTGDVPYAARVVVLEDDNHVMHLSSGWASVTGPNPNLLNPLLDYAVEADAYMMFRWNNPEKPRTRGGHFFLRSSNYGTAHLRGGYIVRFEPDNPTDPTDPEANMIIVQIAIYCDGFTPIIAVQDLSELGITLNAEEWYRLKVSVIGDTYGEIHIKAFIDDVLVLDHIDDGMSWNCPPYRGDQAGYTTLSGYYSNNYYDNVQIYTIEPNQAPSVDAGGPYSVDEGGSVEVTASGTDYDEGDVLTFAWDLDNDGTFETPGHSVPFSAVGLNGPSTQTIAVQVTDSGGLTATDDTTVEIANVAPSVGPITAPVDPVQVGMSVDVEASFADPGTEDTHTAVWDWDDGNQCDTTITNPDCALSQSPGFGSVTGSHTYTTPGVYTVTLRVTDNDGDSGESIFEFVVVYDPSGGFVTGGGWIDSPEGAYEAEPSLTGKATFGFVSKYKNGADIPTGQTQFQFKVADLNFHSDTYQWLVVAGPQAKFKGTGTINGTGNYGFMLSAVDEKLTPSIDVDAFRIKIWDIDDGDNLVYDNEIGIGEDIEATTEIGGGSIVIHK